MGSPLVLIGVDAAEATLIERGATAGDFPAFAQLMEQGTVCHLANSLETLPGAIWPELVSGRSCGKVPLYYHPQQLHTGEARVRPVTEEEVNPHDYFWAVASAAGKRAAVIDVPQTVRTPGLNGVQLFEWGLHDRNFRIASDPPELLDEVHRRFGDHPVTSCDLHKERRRGYEKLLTNLLAGVERKTSLLGDLLQREDWDLFVCAYGESHCVGHQFWHFSDPTHAKHRQGVPEHLREAILRVYRAIDSGIGVLMKMAGPDATVIVVTSHGMGNYTGGPQLLNEVLVRLGIASGGQSVLGQGIRQFQKSVSHMPRKIQPLLRRLAYTMPARLLQRRAGCLLDPLESAQTRATALRNNRCGAVRLNLKGREPFGAVEPGEEAQALIDDLRREFLALEEPKTGERIVAKVVTADEAFGIDHHPDVPDLMVVFRTDLGVLESCRSERVGEVHVPLYHPNIPRTGDHTTESRLWMMGPVLVWVACVLWVAVAIMGFLLYGETFQRAGNAAHQQWPVGGINSPA